MTKTALGLLLGLALTCTAHAQQDDGEDGGYPSLKCLKESVVYGQAANAKNRWGESHRKRIEMRKTHTSFNGKSPALFGQAPHISKTPST